jgi:hypothetical protein
MAIFNSYVCLPEGNHQSINQSINPINQLTNEAIKFGLHQTTPVTTLRREGPCPLHAPHDLPEMPPGRAPAESNIVGAPKLHFHGHPVRVLRPYGPWASPRREVSFLTALSL